MKNIFQKIISEYLNETKKPLKNNQLASFIRNELKDSLNEIVNNERYLVVASPGQGLWTATPWVAIFDRFITLSAQGGFYPVFIFRDDMTGFYLTLNQGVTKIRENHKKHTLKVLRIEAEKFRAEIGHIPRNFNDLNIELHFLPSTKIGLARDYEAGNIVAKFYPADNLPSDEIFRQDIFEIIDLYKSLVYIHDSSEPEEEDPQVNSYKGEESKKYRQHKRIERNKRLIQEVKKIQGFTCKACNLNFTDKYGDLGKEFIEAHHLKPISQLTEEIVLLDADKDFTVLCSNCHRMIHKTKDPSDLEGFKSYVKTI